MKIFAVKCDSILPDKDSSGNFINLNQEFVTLQNDKRIEQDLSFWKLKDQKNNTFVFPFGIKVSAGSTISVYTGEGTNSVSKIYWGRKSFVWSNNADTAYLYDSKEELQDTVMVSKVNVTVTGLVKDAYTGNPINKALVSAKLTDVEPKETGTDGRYSISIPSTVRKLIATKLGYIDKEETVPLTNPKMVNFNLSPSGSDNTIFVNLTNQTVPSTVDIKADYSVSLTFKNEKASANLFHVELYERRAGLVEWNLIDERIYDELFEKDETKVVHFSVRGKTWQWFNLDWGFAETNSLEQSQTYEYRINYRAEKPLDNLEFTEESVIGQTVVSIPNFKKEAREDHNDYQWYAICSFVGCLLGVIGSAIAGAFTMGVGAIVGMAAVSVFFDATAYAFLLQKESEMMIMNDPFSLVSGFKKIFRSAVNTIQTTSQNVVRSSSVQAFNSVSRAYSYMQDFDATKDRLYSAYCYGKSSIINKQKQKLLAIENKVNAEFENFKNMKNTIMGQFGGQLVLSSSKFEEARNYLRNNPFPQAFKDIFTKYEITDEQLENMRQSIIHVNTTGRSFDYGSFLTATESKFTRMKNYIGMIKDELF